MALSTILTAVNAQLATLNASIATAIGSENLDDQNTVPPRIVWVPTTSQAQGARVHGASNTSPRSLGTRVTHVEAHIWGKGTDGDMVSDFDACELVLQQLVQALRATLAAAYEYLGDRWERPEEGSAMAQFGRSLVASFSFPTPLPDETLTTTRVAPVTEAQSGEMDFPDGTIVTGTPAP